MLRSYTLYLLTFVTSGINVFVISLFLAFSSGGATIKGYELMAYVLLFSYLTNFGLFSWLFLWRAKLGHWLGLGASIAVVVVPLYTVIVGSQWINYLWLIVSILPVYHHVQALHKKEVDDEMGRNEKIMLSLIASFLGLGLLGLMLFY
jgi:hypothetical protein